MREQWDGPRSPICPNCDGCKTSATWSSQALLAINMDATDFKLIEAELGCTLPLAFRRLWPGRAKIVETNFHLCYTSGCVSIGSKNRSDHKAKLRQSLKTSSLSFGRANNESMHPDKRIRYTLTAVVANTLLAISAFCCAFILAAAGLPSEIMATSIAATVGMFVAYGTVVAALLVFGNTRLSVS